MLRKIAIAAVGVLTLGTIGVAGAGASTTPPTGTLSCGTTGTITFKPALSGTTPSTKKTSVKVHKASLDACDSSLVNGGKAAITGGDVQLNAKLDKGASCQSLAGAPALVKPVLIVKLTNTTGTKTSTVAVVKPTDITVTQSGLGFLLKGTIPQTKANNKPFGGETLEAQVNVDNIGDFLGCLGGANDVSHLDFSAGGGSTLSIHS